MIHEGHTPTSLLTKEWEYCLATYEGAAKAIALRVIDLYHADVHPKHREIKFKFPEQEPDPDKAITHNVKKVAGYFKETRTVHLPYSFAPFIARAIDLLYSRELVQATQRVLAGPKAYRGDIAEIPESIQVFHKETVEVLQKYLGINIESLSEDDRQGLIKELRDVEPVLHSLLTTLQQDNKIAKIK